jgi:two-component sensor histidine kinase
MTRHILEAVFWCVAGAALTALVLLFRQHQITATLRKRTAQMENDLRLRDEEAAYLVTDRLPTVTESQHCQPAALPGLRHRELAGTAYAKSLDMVMALFAGAVDRAQVHADQSAKAALKASMRALQGLANEQQITISEMQDRHDNPDVLQGLLQIDHANSQFGRRAQAIAVLCGSWPGRQRAASSVTDVVRGATSRIRDYRRVQVHAQLDIAVVSRAVEPVVLAIAELLDNAARHSQPNTTVEVNIQAAHNGACIVIDDAGVGMNTGEVDRAAQLLSGRQAVDVTKLGDPPQFGFAVIGVLAARYGFSVSVDTPSPYGGVRAVLFLPSALLTHPGADAPGAPSAAPAAAPPAAPPAEARGTSGHPEGTSAAAVPLPPQASDSPQGPSSTVGGLPKRRRRQPLAEQASGPQPVSEQPMADVTEGRSAEESAARMGAFARGTRSGRAATPDDEGNPQA